MNPVLRKSDLASLLSFKIKCERFPTLLRRPVDRRITSSPLTATRDSAVLSTQKRCISMEQLAKAFHEIGVQQATGGGESLPSSHSSQSPISPVSSTDTFGSGTLHCGDDTRDRNVAKRTQTGAALRRYNGSSATAATSQRASRTILHMNAGLAAHLARLSPNDGNALLMEESMKSCKRLDLSHMVLCLLELLQRALSCGAQGPARCPVSPALLVETLRILTKADLAAVEAEMEAWVLRWQALPPTAAAPLEDGPSHRYEAVRRALLLRPALSDSLVVRSLSQVFLSTLEVLLLQTLHEFTLRQSVAAIHLYVHQKFFCSAGCLETLLDNIVHRLRKEQQGTHWQVSFEDGEKDEVLSVIQECGTEQHFINSLEFSSTLLDAMARVQTEQLNLARAITTAHGMTPAHPVSSPQDIAYGATTSGSVRSLYYANDNRRALHPLLQRQVFDAVANHLREVLRQRRERAAAATLSTNATLQEYVHNDTGVNLIDIFFLTRAVARLHHFSPSLAHEMTSFLYVYLQVFPDQFLAGIWLLGRPENTGDGTAEEDEMFTKVALLLFDSLRQTLQRRLTSNTSSAPAGNTVKSSDTEKPSHAPQFGGGTEVAELVAGDDDDTDAESLFALSSVESLPGSAHAGDGATAAEKSLHIGGTSSLASASSEDTTSVGHFLRSVSLIDPYHLPLLLDNLFHMYRRCSSDVHGRHSGSGAVSPSSFAAASLHTQFRQTLHLLLSDSRKGIIQKSKYSHERVAFTLPDSVVERLLITLGDFLLFQRDVFDTPSLDENGRETVAAHVLVVDLLYIWTRQVYHQHHIFVNKGFLMKPKGDGGGRNNSSSSNVGGDGGPISISPYARNNPRFSAWLRNTRDIYKTFHQLGLLETVSVRRCSGARRRAATSAAERLVIPHSAYRASGFVQQAIADEKRSIVQTVLRNRFRSKRPSPLLNATPSVREEKEVNKLMQSVNDSSVFKRFTLVMKQLLEL